MKHSGRTTVNRGVVCSWLDMSPLRTAFHAAMVWAVLLVLLLLQHGCAIRSPLPSVETRTQVRTVIVVPGQYPPSKNLVDVDMAPGTITPAGAWIFWGFGMAFATYALIMAFSGTLNTAVALGGSLFFITIFSLDVQPAPPKGVSHEINQKVADSVSALDASKSLAQYLTASLLKEPALQLQTVTARGPATPEERPSYAALKAKGVDAVLEVAVTEVNVEVCANQYVYPTCPGDQDDPLISLRLKSRARLVRVADGSALYARTFWYESRPRTVSEWAEQGGQPVTQALELGWHDLAGRIVDELFLVTPLPIPTPGILATSYNPYAGHCWLRPFYPETSDSKEVESLTPQLTWEPFPRALDHERASPELIAKIRDVTYDLKIWEADEFAPGRMMYERTGLPDPSHQLQLRLEPGRSYFWTFRARFTADGQPMVTRWAFGSFAGSWVHGPRDESGSHKLEVCHSDQIDFHNYYRFTTPMASDVHTPLEQ